VVLPTLPVEWDLTGGSGASGGAALSGGEPNPHAPKGQIPPEAWLNCRDVIVDEKDRRVDREYSRRESAGGAQVGDGPDAQDVQQQEPSRPEKPSREAVTFGVGAVGLGCRRFCGLGVHGGSLGREGKI
jgi:hypothetical protein